MILAILVTACITKITIKDKKKQEKIILDVGIVLIFLLLILKGETVGADIQGYRIQYEISRKIPWDRWDYMYFENGYLALQKLFSKMGLSFQAFTVVLYFVFCSAMHTFISKYSKNTTLSLMIMICYQFLVFSISGLRQTLAMGICIFAFCICKEKKRIIVPVLLILIAMQIHSSAVVFLVVPFVNRMSSKNVSLIGWAGTIVLCIVGRKYIWNLMERIYDVDPAEAVWGGNLLFILGITAFVSFTYFCTTKGKESEDAFAVRISIMALIAYFVFCGSTLLRASMYFTMFYIWVIPKFTVKYTSKERLFINSVIVVFLILLFYAETLAVNQLHIIPYRFFWQ